MMILASKIGWAEIAVTLLTIAMLLPGFPRSAAGSDSGRERVAVFVIKNEIEKMQETLRSKGLYQGKVDGVFGQWTRAGIRAYQMVENLPVTGQVDPRTAVGLGIRPESTWGNSEDARPEVGHGGYGTGGDKPSAGIRRSEGRTSKTSRKELSSATAIEDNRGDGLSKQQAAPTSMP
jgi:peptidoglycan hydrolase-like protein with peptidoglycan-binding domain